VRAGRLEVATQTLTGGEQSASYEMLPKTAFPLTARERIRRQLVEPGQGNEQVFDLRQRGDARPRLADRTGTARSATARRVLDVRELKTSWGNVENVEWLDAAGTCIRREVSGPALVAVPTSGGDRARRRQVRRSPARGRDPQGEAGSLRAVAAEPVLARRRRGSQDGQVLVRNEIEDATVDLVLLEHLDKGLGLESVGSAVMRWLKLLRPDLKIEKRPAGPCAPGPRSASRPASPGTWAAPATRARSRTWVFVAHGKTLAMTCESSARPSPALEADLARMLQMAERRPALSGRRPRGWHQGPAPRAALRLPTACARRP
jgi:hypothetical protein